MSLSGEHGTFPFFSEFIVEKGKSSGIYACELQTSPFLLCQQKAILKLLLT